MAHFGYSGGSRDRSNDHSSDTSFWRADRARKSSRHYSPQQTSKSYQGSQHYSSQVEQRHETEGDNPFSSHIANSSYPSTSNTTIPRSGRWFGPPGLKDNHVDLKHNPLSTARDEDHDPNLGNSRRIDGPPRVALTRPSPSKQKHRPPPNMSKGSSILPNVRRNEASSFFDKSGKSAASNRQFNRFIDSYRSEDAPRNRHYPERSTYPNDKQSTYRRSSNPYIEDFRKPHWDSIKWSSKGKQPPTEPPGLTFANEDQLLTPDSMSFSSPELESRSIIEDDITSEGPNSHNHNKARFSTVSSASTYPASSLWDTEPLEASNTTLSDPIPGFEPANSTENSTQVPEQVPLKRPLSPSSGPEPKRPRLELDTSTIPSLSNNPGGTALEVAPVCSTSPIPVETKPISPHIKLESSPILPPDPIDVDAPPLSLYEQLGLPMRTSGSHRVIRPIFKRSDPRGKEKWTEQMCDDIRWVRGRGEAAQPLIIGNIFWRSDGVCFDWKVSDQELEQTSSVHAESSTSTAEHIQRDAPSTIGNNDRVERPSSDITPLERDDRHGINSVVVKEEVDDAPGLLSLVLYEQTPVDNAASNAVYEARDRDEVLSKPLIKHLSPQALSNIAICFLDRFTRCFDYPAARSKLAEAYTSDAVMSLQFNDLPTIGVCPRVGRPERQTHLIMDFASRDYGRNLHSERSRGRKGSSNSLAIGPEAILDRLSTFDDLIHTSSMISTQPYRFDISPLYELGYLLLNFRGELYTRTTRDGNEGSISLRFDRTFILQPNKQDMHGWIDWPWVISNDQLTLFHRPGVICQCPY